MRHFPMIAGALVCLSVAGCSDHSLTAPDVPLNPARDMDLGDTDALSPDVEAALDNFGMGGGLFSLWDPKAKVSLISGPAAGTTFRITRPFMLTQTGLPKFVLKATPSKAVKQGGVFVFFVTSGGQDCAMTYSTPGVVMKANVAKNITTKPYYAPCQPPFTTTKIRLHFGGDKIPFAQKLMTRTYRFVRG